MSDETGVPLGSIPVYDAGGGVGTDPGDTTGPMSGGMPSQTKIPSPSKADLSKTPSSSSGSTSPSRIPKPASAPGAAPTVTTKKPASAKPSSIAGGVGREGGGDRLIKPSAVRAKPLPKVIQPVKADASVQDSTRISDGVPASVSADGGATETKPRLPTVAAPKPNAAPKKPPTGVKPPPKVVMAPKPAVSKSSPRGTVPSTTSPSSSSPSPSTTTSSSSAPAPKPAVPRAPLSSSSTTSSSSSKAGTKPAPPTSAKAKAEPASAPSSAPVSSALKAKAPKPELLAKPGAHPSTVQAKAAAKPDIAKTAPPRKPGASYKAPSNAKVVAAAKKAAAAPKHGGGGGDSSSSSAGTPVDTALAPDGGTPPPHNLADTPAAGPASGLALPLADHLVAHPEHMPSNSTDGDSLLPSRTSAGDTILGAKAGQLAPSASAKGGSSYSKLEDDMTKDVHVVKKADDLLVTSTPTKDGSGNKAGEEEIADGPKGAHNTAAAPSSGRDEQIVAQKTADVVSGNVHDDNGEDVTVTIEHRKPISDNKEEKGDAASSLHHNEGVADEESKHAEKESKKKDEEKDSKKKDEEKDSKHSEKKDSDGDKHADSHHNNEHAHAPSSEQRDIGNNHTGEAGERASQSRDDASGRADANTAAQQGTAPSASHGEKSDDGVYHEHQEVHNDGKQSVTVDTIVYHGEVGEDSKAKDDNKHKEDNHIDHGKNNEDGSEDKHKARLQEQSSDTLGGESADDETF